MRSIRFKSLLIDFLFTAVSLPPGDDARGLASRHVGYNDQPAGEQTQRDEPFFSIVEAVVLERDARPGKHPLGVFEAQAVLGEVTAVLRFISLVRHPQL